MCDSLFVLRKEPEKWKQLLEHKRNTLEECAVCSTLYKHGCIVKKSMAFLNNVPLWERIWIPPRGKQNFWKRGEKVVQKLFQPGNRRVTLPQGGQHNENYLVIQELLQKNISYTSCHCIIRKKEYVK